MRPLADRPRVERFMEALGKAARSPARVYLTGGATAVLEGWRGSTVDVDLNVDDMIRTGRVEVPELMRLFREIEPSLHRCPAIDPPTFRRAVEQCVTRTEGGT